MLAMTLVIGSLFGFINSAQQIFADVFQEPKLFSVIFAAIAASIACASLLADSDLSAHAFQREAAH
jgi:DHA1 family bicyclomycin/chloramphenicol resistance-like MFS transporter